MTYRYHERLHQNSNGTWETIREPIYYESEEEKRERLLRSSLENNPQIQSIDGNINPHFQPYVPPTDVNREEQLYGTAPTLSVQGLLGAPEMIAMPSEHPMLTADQHFLEASMAREAPILVARNDEQERMKGGWSPPPPKEYQPLEGEQLAQDMAGLIAQDPTYQGVDAPREGLLADMTNMYAQRVETLLGGPTVTGQMSPVVSPVETPLWNRITTAETGGDRFGQQPMQLPPTNWDKPRDWNTLPDADKWTANAKDHADTQGTIMKLPQKPVSYPTLGQQQALRNMPPVSTERQGIPSYSNPQVDSGVNPLQQPFQPVTDRPPEYGDSKNPLNLLNVEDERLMNMVDSGILSSGDYISLRENAERWKAQDAEALNLKADKETNDEVESEPYVQTGLLGDQHPDSNEADNSNSYSINLNEVPSLIKEKISHWYNNTNFAKSFKGWKSSAELLKQSKEIHRGKTGFWHENNVNNQQLDAIWSGIKDAYKGTIAPFVTKDSFINALHNPDHPRHQEAVDLPKNLTRGTAQGLLYELPQGTLELGADVVNFVANKFGLEDVLTEDDISFIPEIYPKDKYPELWESGAFNFAKVSAQLMSGYGAIKTALKKSLFRKDGIKSKMATEVLSTGGAGLTLDPTEGNLSTMLNNTDFRNAITEYLASDTDSKVAEDRLKARLQNFVEEGLFGTVASGFLFAQHLKNTPDALHGWGEVMDKVYDVSTMGAGRKDIVPDGPKVGRPWKMTSKGDGDFYIQRVGPNAGKVSKTRNGPSDIAFSVDQDVLLPDYAYYSVMNLEKQLQARAHGSVQQAINHKDVDAVLTDFFQNQNPSVLGQPDLPLARVDDAGFYLKSEQALLDDPRQSFSPQGLLTVKKDGDIAGDLRQAGVSVQEMREIGLVDFITEQQQKGVKKIYKQSLLDFIDENRPRTNIESYKGRGIDDDIADENYADELDYQIYLHSPDNYPEGLTSGSSQLEVMDGSDFIDARVENMMSDLSYDDYREPTLDLILKFIHEQDPINFPITPEMELKSLKNTLLQIKRKHKETKIRDGEAWSNSTILPASYDKHFNDLELLERKGYGEIYNDHIGNASEDFVNQSQIDEVGRPINNKFKHIYNAVRKFIDDTETRINELTSQSKNSELFVDETYWTDDIRKQIEEQDPFIDDVVYDMAEAEYKENPEYEWETNSGYTARGNEDVGIALYDNNYNEIDTGDGNVVWSVSEAEVQMREHFVDNGGMDDVRGGGGDTNWGEQQYNTPGIDLDTYEEIPVYIQRKGENFEDSNVRFHSLGAGDADKGFLFHIRKSIRQDAEGNSYWFKEELQSDLHQKGRKDGFAQKGDKEKIEKLKATEAKIKADSDEIANKISELQERLRLKFYNEFADANTLQYGKQRLDEMATDSTRERLETDPTLLTLKKDLSKALDKRIDWNDKLETLTRKVADAPLKKEKWLDTGIKTAVKRAIDDGIDRIAWTTAKQQEKVWSSSYATLYKNVYDKKMPKLAKKYADEMGGKVGTVELDFDGDMVEVHYLEITPEMKENLTEPYKHNKGRRHRRISKTEVTEILDNEVRQPLYGKFAIPAGGLLSEEDKIQLDDGGLMDNVESWSPDSNLMTFIKTMENDRLRVGKAKVKGYNDITQMSEGYGSLLGSVVDKTEKGATEAKINDLIEANKAVDRLVKIKLNKGERNALVSLIDNIGATKFARSNAIKALNKGDKKTFLKEAFDPKIGFVKSKNKKTGKLEITKGLVNRRTRERMIFTKGEYGN